MNRAELRQRETAIWARLLDSLLANHWTQVGIKILAVICGSLAAGIGGGMEGPLTAQAWPTLKGSLVIFGAGSSAVGGLLLIAADRERPGLIGDVRRDLEVFREYLDLHDQMSERESWRVDCDNALKIMLEAVEKSLLNTPGSVTANMQAVLDVSYLSLLDALGVVDGEDYTISIFKRDDGAGEMVRLAQQWYSEADTVADTRSWAKTQGFTGQAWVNRRTIGVPDALDPVARQIYTRPPEKTFEPGNLDGVRADNARYRSFACVPIMVGVEQEPWGMLTITSDIVGRFDAVGARTRGGDNIPMIKIAAALMALVATGEP